MVRVWIREGLGCVARLSFMETEWRACVAGRERIREGAPFHPPPPPDCSDYGYNNYIHDYCTTFPRFVYSRKICRELFALSALQAVVPLPLDYSLPLFSLR